MKVLYSLLAPALAFVLPSASAQAPPSSSLRSSATVVQPSSAIAPPAAKALQPAAKAALTSPAAAAGTGKAVVPEGLFGMEDRAIIIVSGKSRAAGDVKREIKAELQRLSGPAQTLRTGSRLKSVPVQHVMENPGGAPRPKTGAGALTSRPATSVEGLSMPSAAVQLGGIRKEALVSPKEYCRTHAPEVSRVRGALTPNERFTIEGLCFGDTTGSVQVIGQFPGGNMKLVFERWTDDEIVAFVPKVVGAADHAVALTVVRTDKTRTAAAQAKFVATRERVEVPGRYWSPSERFDHIGVVQGGGNIFAGFTVNSASAGSYTTPFTLSINPACALDNAAWSSSVGRVDAFNGWDDGPPHEAKVSVVWTPRCTTQTTNYVFASSSQRICSMTFNLKAWAMCPLGVAP
jgi:hypothetical protein